MKPQDNNEHMIANIKEADDLEMSVLAYLDKLKSDPNTDQRWLAIARTDLEKGFMAVTRALVENI